MARTASMRCRASGSEAGFTSKKRDAMVFILGFTGTREGVSRPAQEKIQDLFETTFSSVLSIHHGDCLGADAWFDSFIRTLNATHARALPIARFIHPPNNPKLRAFCHKKIEDALTLFPEKSYLERNRDIVNASDALLAVSSSMFEETRSGTWSTVRYAKKLGKSVTVVLPDGTLGV